MSAKTAPETPFEEMMNPRSFLDPPLPPDGNTILVTGGPGSFGRQLARTHRGSLSILACRGAR